VAGVIFLRVFTTAFILVAKRFFFSPPHPNPLPRWGARGWEEETLANVIVFPQGRRGRNALRIKALRDIV
jgi:hypothetical protein